LGWNPYGSEERLSEVPTWLPTVPITEFECPRCGDEVKMGLPKEATVKSVTQAERPEPADSRRKVRSLVCDNDHEFFVMFAW
jgi:hypothetical protein